MAVETIRTERRRREPYGLEHRSRFYFLVLPILVSVGLWFLTFVFAGWSFAWQILTVVGLSLTVVGPTVILGRAVLGSAWPEHVSLDTFHVATAIAYMSVLMAFVFAYNLDLFDRIPRVGDWFRRVRIGAQRTLREHKWIRRLAVAGVGIFVLLPLPGSGSLGGCIVGRLIGLGPLRTFLATGVAGIVVAIAYGYGGDRLGRFLDAKEIDTGQRLAGVGVVLVLLWLVMRFIGAVAKRTPNRQVPNAE
jgi:uncharacterized membrane protein